MRVGMYQLQGAPVQLADGVSDAAGQPGHASDTQQQHAEALERMLRRHNVGGLTYFQALSGEQVRAAFKLFAAEAAPEASEAASDSSSGGEETASEVADAAAEPATDSPSGAADAAPEAPSEAANMQSRRMHQWSREAKSLH